MQKKKRTFASIMQTQKKVISQFYYKYIFLIIIVVTILVGIIFYKLDAHIMMFGDIPSALGEYVKTLATVMGGALLILGLWINNRRVTEQIRQNNIAEKAQINTRFKDAATLLGSENVSSILSGIYALHQIAMEVSVGNKRQEGYISVIHDILCAYIRENTDNVRNEENGKMWRVNKRPAIVIQTILKVLFKNEKFIYSNLITDLSDCVFEYIDLDNAHLSGVDFSRTKFIKSSFKETTFFSCYFEETFIDGVDFSKSSFEKVIFDFSQIKNTIFANSKMKDSDFWDAGLTKVDFKNTEFRNVDFKGSIFNEDVSFENTSLMKYSLDEIRTQSTDLTKY